MSRMYTVELECGCLVSEDGGGGLIPCQYEDVGDVKQNKLHKVSMELYEQKKKLSSVKQRIEAGEDPLTVIQEELG